MCAGIRGQQCEVAADMNDTDNDEPSVPSFQEAFNDAFQTASESVFAAHKSEDT